MGCVGDLDLGPPGPTRYARSESFAHTLLKGRWTKPEPKDLLGLVPGYFTRYTPMPFHVADNQDISESAFKNCPKKGKRLLKVLKIQSKNSWTK